MLRTYSKSITATANTAIPFNTDKINIGNSVTHPSATNINVNRQGYYMVTLDVSYTSGTVGLSSIQLFADGVAIPDAIITDTIVADSYNNSSFTTIIRANRGDFANNVTLTVVPTTDITISNIALGVNRIA